MVGFAFVGQNVSPAEWSFKYGFKSIYPHRNCPSYAMKYVFFIIQSDSGVEIPSQRCLSVRSEAGGRAATPEDVLIWPAHVSQCYHCGRPQKQSHGGLCPNHRHLTFHSRAWRGLTCAEESQSQNINATIPSHQPPVRNFPMNSKPKKHWTPKCWLIVHLL